jgi:branched-chain amino acid transport system substrate-binding protein
MTRSTVAAIIATALMLTTAGCAVPKPLPTPTPTLTESTGQTGDGVLRIGALLPMGGDTTGIGAGMVAAIERAVRDANVAGGVLGVPVETFYREAGSVDDERLEAGFADLVTRDVDVIMGPADSELLARLLPLAADAGVAVIAAAAPGPTVGAATPTGVLLRTIPAVDRDVVGLMQSAVDAGAESIALVAGSNAQGKAVVDAARAALADGSATVTAVERADAGTNIRRLAFSLAAGEPDAIAIATTGVSVAQLAELVTALLDRGVRGDQLWFSSDGVADFSTSVEAGALEGATAVRAGAAIDDEFARVLRQSDPRLRELRFAAETYDAVVLAVLAAVIAGDDGGPSIARTARAALTGDVVCRSVGECLDALANDQTIDYDGVSGPLGVDDAGDVVTAELSVFRFDAENRPQAEGGITLLE